MSPARVPSPPHARDFQFASAVSFTLTCQNWAKGVAFSELAGFSSAVAHQEYSFSGARTKGNVLTRQLGRASAPTMSLKGALDKDGFAKVFGWHKLARNDDPKAKVAATFEIHDAGRLRVVTWKLNAAWCAKLEVGAAQTGATNVVMMTATIECDEIEV